MAQPSTSDTIPLRLSRAWKLLCGADRVFEWGGADAIPAFNQYAYLLSLDLDGSQVKAGIALSLCREDAIDLTCAMFKLPPEQLSERDVDDACLEVCNVLGDSLTELIAPKERIHTRLPQCLEVNGDRQLLRIGTLRNCLNSTFGQRMSCILVFNPLDPGFETRPCPL